MASWHTLSLWTAKAQWDLILTQGGIAAATTTLLPLLSTLYPPSLVLLRLSDSKIDTTEGGGREPHAYVCVRAAMCRARVVCVGVCVLFECMGAFVRQSCLGYPPLLLIPPLHRIWLLSSSVGLLRARRTGILILLGALAV